MELAAPWRLASVTEHISGVAVTGNQARLSSGTAPGASASSDLDAVGFALLGGSLLCLPQRF